MAYEYIPLKSDTKTEVIPAMTKEFGYKNKLEVPRVYKVVVNMGIGEGSRNADLLEIHGKELTNIVGQKPVITRAKKSIANFKLRDGMPVGLKVTLRGPRMYNFLYKLINIVLPKLRDFRGVDPDSFDG
jgi:large subunit ribosomal protein L5